MSSSYPKPANSKSETSHALNGVFFISSLLVVLFTWAAFEISKWFATPVLLTNYLSCRELLIWIGRGVLQFLVIGVFVYVLSHAEQQFPLSRGWRLRSAFLVALGLMIVILPSIWNFSKINASLWVSAGFWGAFAGGLAATASETSLLEENLPPDEQVLREVISVHQNQSVVPFPFPRWKRLFDLGLLLITAPFTIPLGVLLAFFLWMEDPGAVFFVKNSVGRGGQNFRQLKFRTMRQGAEDETGPVLAQQNDPRVLWVGKFYRKTALDEIPQLLNILNGEMSFVGPRPQRTVLVHRYLRELPQYAFRHAYPPGLAGLAQVAGDYYLTPLQKLRFDRLYIHNASLGFDLRLLFAACLITFVYRWKPGWNGRLPRWVLHSSSRGPALSKRSIKRD